SRLLRRFFGSFCSQKEQFEAGQSSTRARLLEKEIIQTRVSRLNKISASARTENGVEFAIAKRSFARPRDVWPAWPTRLRHGARPLLLSSCSRATPK
ncbi:hypothetical protein, partial [uncultured Rikenella sp.]|uniref:hypothetical protein n=1 Tax=uncultured Rikenella sp. TaxID=368003 RepID=UPI002602DAD4